MILGKFPIVEFPKSVCNVPFREFHDYHLTTALGKFTVRFTKLLKIKHPLVLLQAKKYFEVHYLDLKRLLEEELGKTQITGYYVLLQNFLRVSDSYLEQHLNSDLLTELMTAMSDLSQHLKRYSEEHDDPSANART